MIPSNVFFYELEFVWIIFFKYVKSPFFYDCFSWKPIGRNDKQTIHRIAQYTVGRFVSWYSYLVENWEKSFGFENYFGDSLWRHVWQNNVIFAFRISSFLTLPPFYLLWLTLFPLITLYSSRFTYILDYIFIISSTDTFGPSQSYSLSIFPFVTHKLVTYLFLTLFNHQTFTLAVSFLNLIWTPYKILILNYSSAVYLMQPVCETGKLFLLVSSKSTETGANL